MRRLGEIGALILCTLWLCAGLAATTDSAPATVLYGRIVDGTGADAIEDGALVIDGDTIRAVGHRDTIDVPAGATIIDVGRGTILPGFINTHVHNSHARTVARRWVRGGVTTVRDLGVPYDQVDWNAVSASYGADPKYPLVLWAGPLITVPDGYPIAGNRFPSLAVTSPEDAREKTLDLIERGVDVIKIALALDPSLPACLSVDEIRAIIEVAHAHGLRVTAHVANSYEVERAIDGGVDELAHAFFNVHLRGDWVGELVAAGISWTPTLALDHGAGGDAVVRFLRAGGLVAMGNDAGYLPGVRIGMPMNEIRTMHEVGMTPMEIIVASTSSAARVCRMEDRIGTLAAGMQADVLVVNGNPIEDLEALDEPILVFHRGVLVDDFRS